MTNTKPLTFKQWQQFATKVNARAEKVARQRMDAGFALAATVGIGRDMCCLHNAAIDDELKGWCAGNPERLKVAKRADYMVTEWCWQPTRLAQRLISRAWDRTLKA